MALRDEEVRCLVVMAAAAGQADRIPGVLDFEGRSRCKYENHAGGRRRFGIEGETAADHDVRMSASRGKSPAPSHAIAALHAHGSPIGRRLSGRCKVDGWVELVRCTGFQERAEVAAVRADLDSPRN